MTKRPRKRDDVAWVIQYMSIDSSRDEVVVYPNRDDAIEAAAAFAKSAAENEIETFGEDGLGEFYNVLAGVIADANAGMLNVAVEGWLEYQNAVDPDESIALGPSGSVSDQLHDFV